MVLRRKLAEQFRQPRGLLGKVVGLLLSRANRRANEWTIALLDIQPTDRVLEVGFGPGQGIQRAAELAVQGWVAGVDYSDTMLQQASRRNAAAIAARRVELKQADVAALPYEADAFDKVFGSNVIYFWPEPVASLREIRRVLRPGGRMALFLYDKKDLARRRFAQSGAYRLYHGDEVVQMLHQAGFRRARFYTRRVNRLGAGVCALAEK